MSFGAKSLIVKEDILFGQGQIQQIRAGNNYIVTKVNAESLPYSGDPDTDDVKSVKEIIDDILAASTLDIVVEW